MRVQLSQQLLDRQIVDADGRLVGKVDDIEFGADADGVPYIHTLLTGQVALGQRVGGRIGRLLIMLADRFGTEPPVAPLKIPFHLVTHFDSAVRLAAGGHELPQSPAEGWLRRHVIARIRGAGRASG